VATRGIQSLIEVGLVGGQQAGGHALDERCDSAKEACDASPLPAPGADRRQADQTSRDTPLISDRDIQH
jgi:hypothetical protein